MTLTNPPTDPSSGATISVSLFGHPVYQSLNELDARTADATTGNAALGTRMSAVETSDAGKVPTTRTISAGTGLTGGGDLSANRTLTVAYGTTSTTAAVGNDSRITVTQDGTIGNSALGTRVTSLETNAANTGRGTLIAGGTEQAIANGTATNVTFGGTAPETPVGFSYSAGVITFTKFGKWYLSATFAQGAVTVPAANTVYALRFKRSSDGATFGQNIATLTSTGFGTGTAIGWPCKIDASNAVWRVEIVTNAACSLANDSRTAFSAVYLGP